MNKEIITIFIILSFTLFFSCKLSNKKLEDSKVVSNENSSNSLKGKTFFKLENTDSTVINRLENRAIKQIKANDFEALVAEVDFSFSNKITAKDLTDYFNLVTYYYGSCDTLISNGENTSEYTHSIHKMAKFSSGDSIQLFINFGLIENNLKLLSVNYNKLYRFGNSKRLIATINPTINNLLKKEYKKVFSNCSDNYKTHNKQENIAILWDKHFRDKNNNATKSNISPLIFAKGKVGVLAEFEKESKPNYYKKVQIIYLQNAQNELKIEDIRVSK